jgi:phage repressor protein C with HTH and peptisase S24 domain
MAEQGFLRVPFSDDLRLAAGGGGAVPFTYEAADSPVVVHGPSLGRRSARNLQAFRLGGDSMEPVLASGGIVLADLGHNELDRLREGSIYVLCWDLYDGECAAKYLRWAEKGRWLSIESENKRYAPVVKAVDEVKLIGRIIWAWREFL